MAAPRATPRTLARLSACVRAALGRGAGPTKEKTMLEIEPCPDCLRRSWLLSALGPYIERVAAGRGAPGIRDLLALPEEELIEEGVPAARRTTLIGDVGELSGPQMRESLEAA